MPIDDAKYMLIDLAASPNISIGVRLAPNAQKITRSIWLQHKVILDVHEIVPARAFRWRISHGRAFTAGSSRATWLISMSRAAEFQHFRF